MKRCAAFCGLLVLALVPDARAQQFLNLDFERATAGAARGWYQGGAGYEVVVDSVVAYSGEKSLRIRSVLLDQTIFIVNVEDLGRALEFCSNLNIDPKNTGNLYVYDAYGLQEFDAMVIELSRIIGKSG